jgi:hypothetical protein
MNGAGTQTGQIVAARSGHIAITFSIVKGTAFSRRDGKRERDDAERRRRSYRCCINNKDTTLLFFILFANSVVLPSQYSNEKKQSNERLSKLRPVWMHSSEMPAFSATTSIPRHLPVSLDGLR